MNSLVISEPGWVSPHGHWGAGVEALLCLMSEHPRFVVVPEVLRLNQHSPQFYGARFVRAGTYPNLSGSGVAAPVRKIVGQVRRGFVSREWRSALRALTRAASEEYVVVIPGLDASFRDHGASRDVCHQVHRLSVRVSSLPKSGRRQRRIILQLEKWKRILGGRLTLAGESEPVVRSLQQILGEEVLHVPWLSPMAFQYDSHTFVPFRQATEIQSRPVIMFPGTGQIRKGLLQIPTIVDHLRKLVPDSLFIVGGTLEQSPEALAVVRHLANCSDVVLLPAVQSADSYRSTLLSADLAILPYDDPYYRTSGSGVLSDLAAIGCPLVAPATTTVGTVTNEWGLGLTYSKTAQSLVLAAREVLQQQRSLWESAGNAYTAHVVVRNHAWLDT